ncbi:hypothetical protein [Budvicia aquatica]|uniref:Uncharacterized protein n=1 Tax=Budvicia aquatica TaxID=82979 RepID=A0A2C6DIK8_9GAMM|nr:hypothetical protein [Budvicia aquatica]PHI31046.1 hypothetical protein CRN84_17750 [Budvicia aquatica]VFS51237.1 Uncharacterised protein [Budvicia aquatica]
MPEHRALNVPTPNQSQALQHINLLDEFMRKNRMSADHVLNAVAHIKRIAGESKTPPGPE